MEKQNNYFEPMTQNQIGGYVFKNPLLLEQAFTRKSYTEENGGENNEVLEFIGDKVLDIAVIRYLMKKYGTDMHVQDRIPMGFRVPQDPETFKCQLSEGELTKLKQKMVQKSALARRIDELDLVRYLRVGKGDSLNGIAQNDSAKEDLFEAILGAVAIDSNWNFEKLQNAVEIMLCPDSFIDDKEDEDYVSLIYEWDERKNGCCPYFKYVEGSITSGMHSFENAIVCNLPQGTYECTNYRKICILKLIPGKTIPEFVGFGESNNQARKSACKKAYEYLGERGMLFSIQDEIDNPNLDDSINQLEILARRGYFSLPEYSYEESHDKDGNPIWHVGCSIAEMEHYTEASSSSKRLAKKNAAYSMLRYVLENYQNEK